MISKTLEICARHLETRIEPDVQCDCDYRIEWCERCHQRGLNQEMRDIATYLRQYAKVLNEPKA